MRGKGAGAGAAGAKAMRQSFLVNGGEGTHEKRELLQALARCAKALGGRHADWVKMRGQERSTEMNTQRLVSAFLLTSLLAAPALAFEVKPGEWERVWRKADGKVTSQDKICISPEQAKRFFWVSAQAVGHHATKGCKTNARESKGVVSFETKCDWGLKIEGTMRSIDANEAHLEMTGVGPMSNGGPSVTTTMKIVVKKISDTEIIHSTATTGSAVSGTDQAMASYKYLAPTCGKDAQPWVE